MTDAVTRAAAGRCGPFFARSRVGRIALALAVSLGARAGRAAAARADGPRAEAIRSLSVPFVANEGRDDARVAFRASTSIGPVFVTRRGAIVYALPDPCAFEGDVESRGEWSVVEAPVGAATRPRGSESAGTNVSYFLGNDPSRWRSTSATFRTIDLGAPWPGVRLSLRAYANRVEKLFTLAPGVAANRISMRVRGATSLDIEQDGELAVRVPERDIAFSRPVAYQEVEGDRIPVAASFWARGDRYGFRLGAHDPTRAVVIDPVLRSSYLGGGSSDSATGIAINPSNNDVIVVGATYSTDFPGTDGGAQSSFGGGLVDSFIARLKPDLSQILQATYLGGTRNDYARAVTVHPDTGEVIVFGLTGSTDFPGTDGGAQPARAGDPTANTGDDYVARLTPDLTTLLQATYFGGSALEGGYILGAVTADPVGGDILICGDTPSNDLPGTSGAAQASSGGGYDGFVARFNSTLTSLVRATYIGGSADEGAAGISVDAAGTVYVTGLTQSTDFPGTTGGAQESSGGARDAYVVSFNAGLTTRNQATYLGGSAADAPAALEIHPITGEIVVAGTTASNDFPGVFGGAQSTIAGGTDGFVTRLSASLQTILQSTYLGGSFNDQDNGLAIQSDGQIFAAGTTTSYDFPGVEGAAQTAFHNDEGFVSRLDGNLTQLMESTYVGGHGFDEVAGIAVSPVDGNVLVAGRTISADLPMTVGSAQSAIGGSDDGFVERLTPDLTSALSGVAMIPVALAADAVANAGASDGNGVFEPGETVVVDPSWKNVFAPARTPSGASTALAGPAGPTYSSPDVAAAYPTANPGKTTHCAAAGNCYRFGVGAAPRPATHWDATFHETLSIGDVKTWSLHVGNSFTDVPKTNPFYKKIETMLHYGITSGCTPTQYCPGQSVSRAEMAIFVAKVIAGGGANVPPVGFVKGNLYRCTQFLGITLFSDVSPADIFCKHVHYLAAQNVTSGCSANAFCPSTPIDRDSMAAFIAKAIVAPLGGNFVPLSYGPYPGTGLSYSCDPAAPNVHFTDVPVTDPFCKHVHYLWSRGFVSGCSTTAYCPATLVTRDTMAKFLGNAFALTLYGP